MKASPVSGCQSMPCGIAVPQRVQGVAGDGVVVGHRAVGVEPQNLARRRRRVLRRVRVLGVAHGDVQLVVRAEANAAAVVVSRARHAVKDDGVVAPHTTGVREPGDAVCRAALFIDVGVADVQVAILGEAGVESDAHETGLTLRPHVQLGEWLVQQVPVLNHADAAGPLCDEHAPVRGEGQVPRNAQALHNRLDNVAGRGDRDALGCRALVAAGGVQQKGEGDHESGRRSKEAVMSYEARCDGHQRLARVFFFWPAPVAS